MNIVQIHAFDQGLNNIDEVFDKTDIKGEIDSILELEKISYEIKNNPWFFGPHDDIVYVYPKLEKENFIDLFASKMSSMAFHSSDTFVDTFFKPKFDALKNDGEYLSLQGCKVRFLQCEYLSPNHSLSIPFGKKIQQRSIYFDQQEQLHIHKLLKPTKINILDPHLFNRFL